VQQTDGLSGDTTERSPAPVLLCDTCVVLLCLLNRTLTTEHYITSSTKTEWFYICWSLYSYWI